MLYNTEYITAITINDDCWDGIVLNFPDYDVYYLSGYVKAFRIHGDGEPYLIHYKDSELEGIYVMMVRPTSNPEWFDSTTPYGYGGFLFKGNISENNIQNIKRRFRDFAKKNNIVSNFVRFHPLLNNADYCRDVMDVIDLGHTISIDLESNDLIWSNISSKNRNMIRKAEKNGVQIHHGKGVELLDSFIEIYNRTMEKDNALPYYYFSKDFYMSILNDLYHNHEVFYATYNNVIVSMAIIIYANHKMHYHLSGSLLEYRSVAPSNLLLYKVALWGMENGMKSFHLGGGIGSECDNLYKFKFAFNKNGDHRFSIGKEIYDEKKYNILVKQRAFSDLTFDPMSTFFPLYRS